MICRTTVTTKTINMNPENIRGVTMTNKPEGIVDECRVPTTTIELSTLEDIKGVIESLFEEHYEEIALNLSLIHI